MKSRFAPTQSRFAPTQSRFAQLKVVSPQLKVVSPQLKVVSPCPKQNKHWSTEGFTLEGAWKQDSKTRQQNVGFSSYFHSDLKFGNETHTVCGVTSFQGLPAFLSRSSECCGRTNFFYG